LLKLGLTPGVVARCCVLGKNT